MCLIFFFFLSKKLLCLKGKKHNSTIIKENTNTAWSTNIGWSKKTEVATEKHAVEIKTF